MPIPTTTPEILTACIESLHRGMKLNNLLAHHTACLPADVTAPSPERQLATRLLREALGLPTARPSVLREWLETKPTVDAIQQALERARTLASVAK